MHHTPENAGDSAVFKDTFTHRLLSDTVTKTFGPLSIIANVDYIVIECSATKFISLIDRNVVSKSRRSHETEKCPASFPIPNSSIIHESLCTL